MIPDETLIEWRKEASIIQPPGTLAAIRNERILALIADNDALRCGYENTKTILRAIRSGHEEAVGNRGLSGNLPVYPDPIEMAQRICGDIDAFDCFEEVMTLRGFEPRDDLVEFNGTEWRQAWLRREPLDGPAL